MSIKTHSNSRGIVFLAVVLCSTCVAVDDEDCGSFCYKEEITKQENLSDLMKDLETLKNNLQVLEKNVAEFHMQSEIHRAEDRRCQEFLNCSSCLNSKDSECGWCYSENNCKVKDRCAGALQNPAIWLPPESGSCAVIKNVYPPNMSKATTQSLHLEIENLPDSGGHLYCAFTASNSTVFTSATINETGVTCPNPPTDEMQPFLQTSDHATIELSVRGGKRVILGSTKFTYFDCGKYTSCTKCVSSGYPCDWCIEGHRCTHDTSENCRNDLIISSVSSVGPTIREGPEYCPAIKSDHSDNVIHVPSGNTERVVVKVDSIKSIETTSRFECQFTIEGQKKKVTGQLLGDKVYCEPLELSYSRAVGNITVQFDVLWNTKNPLDNPENVHVVLFKCPYMAENCGLCLDLPETFGCVWCENTCENREICETTGKPLLKRSDICPNPQILQFYPKSGPFEGGTLLTIRGINLGRNPEDIKSISLIGETKEIIAHCISSNTGHINTIQAVCRIGKYLQQSNIRDPNVALGLIELVVSEKFTVKAEEPFMFVNPKIISTRYEDEFKFRRSMLEIIGLNMDAGSTAEVVIGDSVPCNIKRRDCSRLVCTTKLSSELSGKSIQLKIDDAVRTSGESAYYSGEPFVEVMAPEKPQNDISDSGCCSIHSNETGTHIKGIPGGGISFTVRGENFSAENHPEIYVIVDGDEHRGSCMVKNPNQMECKTPKIPEEKLHFYNKEEGKPIEVDYGFNIPVDGGYKSYMVRSQNSYTERPKFLMYPEPEFYPFRGDEWSTVKFYKGGLITIEGRNINQAVQAKDIYVQLGMGSCNVTFLSCSYLLCLPPSTQPYAMDSEGKPFKYRIPQLKVWIGGKKKFVIGYIEYAK